MSQGIQQQTGPFMHMHGAARKFKKGRIVYTIGIAGAYNANGLIGSEYNGIFVLDETNRAVVLDRHLPINSGYNGPSQEQWAEFGRIAKMPLAEFRNFCSNNARFRGEFGQ